jgi:hypothetical protein
MASLKAFLTTFGSAVSMPEAALYERQRALVRHGILKPTPGRGPGSGVELSTYSVATLLIACVATPSLSEVDERIQNYCDAAAFDQICPLTGKSSFRDAIIALLEQKTLVDRVQYISSVHQIPDCVISFTQARKTMNSLFRWKRDDRSVKGIFSSSVVRSEAIQSLCSYFTKEGDVHERSYQRA